MAHSFMAAATTSATLGSSGAPFLIVLRRALYTFSGKRARITSSEKTLAPNIWRIEPFRGGTRPPDPLDCQDVIAVTALWRALVVSMGNGLQSSKNRRQGACLCSTPGPQVGPGGVNRK